MFDRLRTAVVARSGSRADDRLQWLSFDRLQWLLCNRLQWLAFQWWLLWLAFDRLSGCCSSGSSGCCSINSGGCCSIDSSGCPIDSSSLLFDHSSGCRAIDSSGCRSSSGSSGCRSIDSSGCRSSGSSGCRSVCCLPLRYLLLSLAALVSVARSSSICCQRLQYLWLQWLHQYLSLNFSSCCSFVVVVVACASMSLWILITIKNEPCRKCTGVYREFARNC